MARIAVFASREHHTQKLSPIYNQLQRNNHDVFWLTCNNSLNIDSPLEFLVPNSARFVHVYDQVLDKREQKAIDIKANKIISQSSDLIGYFSPFWIINSAKEMAELMVLFEKFLKSSQVNGVIVLHNANFFSRILSFVAQNLKIPVFGFQEGALRDRDQESFEKQSLIAEFTTKTFCWCRDDLDRIKKASPKATLAVGGAYHLDDVFDAIKSRKEKEVKTIAFAPTLRSEHKGDIQSDALWIKSFCQQLGVNFVFKPHPFEKDTFSSDLMPFNGSAKDLLVHADYIISQHSTIMVEAVILGKNVAEINRSGATSTESEVDAGAYAKITNEQDLMNFFNNGHSSKKWIRGKGYKVGNRTEYIVKEIEKLL